MNISPKNAFDADRHTYRKIFANRNLCYKEAKKELIIISRSNSDRMSYKGSEVKFFLHKASHYFQYCSFRGRNTRAKIKSF